jgi:hypothetical protein
MRTALPYIAASSVLPLALLACSSAHHGGAVAAPDGGEDAAIAAVDAAGGPQDAAISGYDGMTTAHGTVIDYFNLSGIPNLTLTAEGQTATTDDAGAFSMMVNGDQPLMPHLTGPNFVELIFPEVVPAQADLDYGPSVMASLNTFSVETSGLGANVSKGLVQVLVRADASCPSVAGGTVTVLSPPGATVVYFSQTGYPDNTLTSLQDVMAPRPAVVVYDVEPGAQLVLQVNHPTCKQVPFPYMRDGRTYTGKVDIRAINPGNFNSALVLQLQ